MTRQVSVTPIQGRTCPGIGVHWHSWENKCPHAAKPAGPALGHFPWAAAQRSAQEVGFGSKSTRQMAGIFPGRRRPGRPSLAGHDSAAEPVGQYHSSQCGGRCLWLGQIVFRTAAPLLTGQTIPLGQFTMFFGRCSSSSTFWDDFMTATSGTTGGGGVWAGRLPGVRHLWCGTSVPQTYSGS